VPCAFALLGTGCATTVGQRGPDFTLTDTHGQTHKLADYRGHVVLLDFWATWCPPCVAASPDIQAIYDRYKPEGLVVLAIHFNDQGDPARYEKTHNYTYTSLLNGFDVARRYGVSQIPTLMILDRDGLIVHRQTGYTHPDRPRIEAIIQREQKRKPA